MSAGGVLSKFAAIGIVVIFAFAMWIIMKIVHKVKGDEEDIGADAAGPAADGMSRMNAHTGSENIAADACSGEEPEEKKEKSFMEKYCNEQKNDSRRMLANYILVHEENERKERGQLDDRLNEVMPDGERTKEYAAEAAKAEAREHEKQENKEEKRNGE